MVKIKTISCIFVHARTVGERDRRWCVRQLDTAQQQTWRGIAGVTTVERMVILTIYSLFNWKRENYQKTVGPTYSILFRNGVACCENRHVCVWIKKKHCKISHYKLYVRNLLLSLYFSCSLHSASSSFLSLSLCFLSFPRAALSTHNGYICMFIGFHIYIISSAMFGNNTHHNKNGQVISPEQQDVKTEKLNLP